MQLYNSQQAYQPQQVAISESFQKINISETPAFKQSVGYSQQLTGYSKTPQITSSIYPQNPQVQLCQEQKQQRQQNNYQSSYINETQPLNNKSNKPQAQNLTALKYQQQNKTNQFQQEQGQSRLFNNQQSSTIQTQAKINFQNMQHPQSQGQTIVLNNDESTKNSQTQMIFDNRRINQSQQNSEKQQILNDPQIQVNYNIQNSNTQNLNKHIPQYQNYSSDKSRVINIQNQQIQQRSQQVSTFQNYQKVDINQSNINKNNIPRINSAKTPIQWLNPPSLMNTNTQLKYSPITQMQKDQQQIVQNQQFSNVNSNLPSTKLSNQESGISINQYQQKLDQNQFKGLPLEKSEPSNLNNEKSKNVTSFSENSNIISSSHKSQYYQLNNQTGSRYTDGTHRNVNVSNATQPPLFNSSSVENSLPLNQQTGTFSREISNSGVQNGVSYQQQPQPAWEGNKIGGQLSTIQQTAIDRALQLSRNIKQCQIVNCKEKFQATSENAQFCKIHFEAEKKKLLNENKNFFKNGQTVSLINSRMNANDSIDPESNLSFKRPHSQNIDQSFNPAYQPMAKSIQQTKQLFNKDYYQANNAIGSGAPNPNTIDIHQSISQSNKRGQTTERPIGFNYNIQNSIRQNININESQRAGVNWKFNTNAQY